MNDINIVQEVNKLIAEYFHKHYNIMCSSDVENEMVHDADAQLDAIDLVCDIANVYNSAIHQCAIKQLEEEIHKAIDKLANAIYDDSCKGEDK